MNWESRLNSQMIILTGLIVAGLFVINAFFLLTPPNTQMEQKLSERKRSPAAVEGQKKILESPGSKRVTRIQEFQLNCFDNTEIFVERAIRQIQLTIGHCQSVPSETPSIQLVNINNNFTASIFSLSQNRYKTDLIQLKPGNNEIVIRSQTLDGKKSLSRLFVKRK